MAAPRSVVEFPVVCARLGRKWRFSGIADGRLCAPASGSSGTPMLRGAGGATGAPSATVRSCKLMGLQLLAASEWLTTLDHQTDPPHTPGGLLPPCHVCLECAQMRPTCSRTHPSDHVASAYSYRWHASRDRHIAHVPQRAHSSYCVVLSQI